MNLKMEKPKEGISVGEYVYDIIKKNIIHMGIHPGHRISENEISELLKVSRTPVREAFIKLSKEGLLYVLPQRGTYVSYIDLDEVEETRFIRESLEKSVINIATKDFSLDLIISLEESLEKQKQCVAEKEYAKFLELDERFHQTIFAGCNKSRTWTIMEQINNQYKRVRLLSFMIDVSWTRVLEQHQQIIDAIREKNEKKGEKTIHEHLNKLIVELVEIKALFPQYFK
ncbi:MAG: GntR family transcriptional regulator [Thermotaleaceae bacterium]